MTFMDLVRIDGGAVELENNTDYTGRGVRAEVMDGIILGSVRVVHRGHGTPPTRRLGADDGPKPFAKSAFARFKTP